MRASYLHSHFVRLKDRPLLHYTKTELKAFHHSHLQLHTQTLTAYQIAASKVIEQCKETNSRAPQPFFQSSKYFVFLWHCWCTVEICKQCKIPNVPSIQNENSVRYYSAWPFGFILFHLLVCWLAFFSLLLFNICWVDCVFVHCIRFWFP